MIPTKKCRPCSQIFLKMEDLFMTYLQKEKEIYNKHSNFESLSKRPWGRLSVSQAATDISERHRSDRFVELEELEDELSERLKELEESEVKRVKTDSIEERILNMGKIASENNDLILKFAYCRTGEVTLSPDGEVFTIDSEWTAGEYEIQIEHPFEKCDGVNCSFCQYPWKTVKYTKEENDQLVSDFYANCTRSVVYPTANALKIEICDIPSGLDRDGNYRKSKRGPTICLWAKNPF